VLFLLSDIRNLLRDGKQREQDTSPIIVQQMKSANELTELDDELKMQPERQQALVCIFLAIFIARQHIDARY